VWTRLQGKYGHDTPGLRVVNSGGGGLDGRNKFQLKLPEIKAADSPAGRQPHMSLDVNPVDATTNERAARHRRHRAGEHRGGTGQRRDTQILSGMVINIK